MSDFFLFTRHTNLERSWPFLHERLVTRLDELGPTVVLNANRTTPIHQQIELEDAIGIVHFGGDLTAECIGAAPKLRVIGTMTDNSGHGLPLEALAARNIPVIESTRAWAQSVAECAFGLALSALRRIPQWHYRMANQEPLWEYPYAQFCDAPDFVNGDLGTKHIGVIGLGQIGRKIAQWCRTFGARVDGYDPFIPDALFKEWDVRSVDMDTLVDEAEIVFVAVPPTPSAKHLLTRERINRLRKGALVVVITRAHAVDMEALRERILADELAGAFDVYDVEPVPVDHPLRGRDNVVHTPHIAGRTKDANLRVADMIVDDFARVIRGEKPLGALTPEAIAVRTQQVELPY
ncbi:MAG: NAD(P)-dependent oxidoreductase [Candidatus Poribacteria bacterium]|nr:NAD(P)-dependent oxidoreductase [Candidatus Poribacteria bacterium]